MPNAPDAAAPRRARTAVAVMAKAPRPGQVKTRLVPPLTPEQAADLYRCCLLDTLDTLRRVRGAEPVVAYAPADASGDMAQLAPDLPRLPQGEGDLGARMLRVVDALLEQGFEAAVLVGGDAPTLPAAYVEQAAAHLADGADLVLGPADDGGYYLIGLCARRPFLFEGMPWSTGAVLAETRRRADASGLRTALLPAWFDVDTAADLERLRGSVGGEAGRRTQAFLARTPL
ncbi:MAG TPA: TIGR04282 family arsenosugar biosynthesis glycosyltransferase [Thermodesulfobacteriota bacterium]